MIYDIKQHGIGLNFIVTSASRPNVRHMVDLRNEKCSCENWVCRLSRPEMGDVPKEARRCKHIKACREWLADYVISKVRE